MNNVSPIHLKSPNKGEIISFELLSYQERLQALTEDSPLLYKIHKNLFYEMPIYELKNGDYLYCLTKDSYAFRFKTLEMLDLLLSKNNGYYNVSTHFNNSGRYY